MQLAHSLVTAPGSAPRQWMLFLHGIFGSGDNWRSFAKRLVEARPAWGAVLVDLREHGRSLGFPPPHTLETAAQDLVSLEASLPGPVRGVLGHSFGGKVTLAYLQRHPENLGPVIVVDSAPGARPDGRGSESTMRVLRLLHESVGPFESRQAFVEKLSREGIEPGIAQFLAKNIERRDGGYFFKLDLAAIDSLLDDYFDQDLWPVLESPPASAKLTLVIGDRSDTLDAADRLRAEQASQKAPGRVKVEVVENAGHWVHVDAPERMYSILLGAVDAAGF